MLQIYGRYHNFEMILPGNELPAWFIEQSSMLSISIEFFPNCHKRKLIGLAIALCLQANSLTDYVYCDVRVCKKNPNITREAHTIYL